MRPPMLSAARRELMLKVIDGRPELPPIMHQFLRLRQCDDVLRWLIKHRLTGFQFIQWFGVEGKTPMQAMALILARINKDPKRPVLAGRDYLVD